MGWLAGVWSKFNERGAGVFITGETGEHVAGRVLQLQGGSPDEKKYGRLPKIKLIHKRSKVFAHSLFGISVSVYYLKESVQVFILTKIQIFFLFSLLLLERWIKIR